MASRFHVARHVLVAFALAVLLTSCGFKRKKYDDPITKDTKQPDKVLFDRAVDDIEHGRYEIARITLNTLINTYDQSEFLAKAKLAIADSWFREGGAASLAQAEAEYKDFILFYPTMEEAAESQQKICQIHYKQMDKVDRDQSQAIRAEDECRQLIVQFPNSKYVDETKQLLRNVQEAIADGEYMVGNFYYKRGDNSAAANRLSHVVEQYPLYSKADLALWQMGQSYGRLGNRFRKQEGEAYSKIVRDYPMSEYADDATRRLKELEMPVPEADKGAVARMQYEKEHREKPGIITPQHFVPEAGTRHEHCRSFWRSCYDHHAAIGSAAGPTTGRRWSCRRYGRECGACWQIRRSGYQAGRSYQSAGCCHHGNSGCRCEQPDSAAVHPTIHH